MKSKMFKSLLIAGVVFASLTSIPQAKALAPQQSFALVAGGPGLGDIHKTAATGTNATEALANPATLYKIIATNPNAVIYYIHLYNVATVPTAGAGTVYQTIAIPASGSTVIALNDFFGIQYGTGIGYTITQAPGDTDTTAVATAGLVVDFLYH